MGQEKTLSDSLESHGYRVEIFTKLPSLNTYIEVCRRSRYEANDFKKKLEREILKYFMIPRIEKPVKIHFHWVEANKRRDLDNIAFAKKFILDAMVKGGYLKDDNRKCVTGFTDSFEYGDAYKVILEIKEDL